MSIGAVLEEGDPNRSLVPKSDSWEEVGESGGGQVVYAAPPPPLSLSH